MAQPTNIILDEVVIVSLDLPLDSLTTAEKLALVEAIWSDLCGSPSEVQSPEWHKKVIAERIERLESGEAKTVSWTEAKMRLRRLGE